MFCILCFSDSEDLEYHGIFDYNGKTLISGEDLIRYHLNNFVQKILTDEIIGNADSAMCDTCWGVLENFNDFFSMVENNYSDEQMKSEDDVKNETETAENFIEGNSEQYSITAIEDDQGLLTVHKEEIVDSDSKTSGGCVEVNWIEVEIPPTDAAIKIKSNITDLLKRNRQSFDKDDEAQIQTVADMVCNICQQVTFRNLKDAKKHMKKQHHVEGYIVCCNRQFKQRIRLIEHVRTAHFGDAYKCPYCDKNFESKGYLTKHMATHEEDKVYECDFCGKGFAQKFQLRSHMQGHLLAQLDPLYECQFDGCSKMFVNIPKLNHHIRYYHDKKPNRCDICGKSFSQKSNLEVHLKSHARRPGERIKCKLCDHYLIDKKTYQRHMKNHSTEHLDNVCEKCGKRSPNQDALKKHIQFVHEKIADFKCNHCDKSFKRSRNLKDHIAAIHTLQNIYSCEFCNRTFRNHSNMLSHRKKQHPDKYVKPAYLRE